MEIIYWIIVAIIFYTYFGYPILLYLLIKLFSFKSDWIKKESNTWPDIDLLITAYNEENVIGAKIENTLSLNYPADSLNIWVASDGSTDNTNAIVHKYSETNKNVNLLEFQRTGKSGAINKSIKFLKREIVVFSDANTEYSTDALKNLIRHFNDPGVGCVSGRLIYRNPGETISGIGESFYWRYETSLKKMESKIGYVAGANGAIYAIRKHLFHPFHPRTINDDFTTSMKIVKRGYKSIYADNALVYEDVAPNMLSEFNRHVRDSAGHYIAIIHLLGLLNPFLGIRSFIYWSHRILRWMIPFLLITIFILNIFLWDNLFYIFLFIFQCVFYLLAFVGWLSLNYVKLPFYVYVPFYFCNLNIALLLGFIRVLTNKQKPTWESTAR